MDEGWGSTLSGYVSVLNLILLWFFFDGRLREHGIGKNEAQK